MILLRKIAEKLRDIYVRIYIIGKPDLAWLYENRYLRMDINTPINAKKRRFFHKDRYEFAVNVLKNMQNKGIVILDAACGTGYGSDIMKRVNPRKNIGVDICPKTIQYARNAYGNDKCVFEVADVTNMREFPGSMFDAVVSFETIEHLDKPIMFLENMHRLLKKDGCLIISTPNKWGPTRDHHFDYDYDLFKNHLERYFTIEDIYIQNSGCMELWVNRDAPRRLIKLSSDNKEEAECFIAICRK